MAYENSQIVTLFGFFLIRLAFAQAIHGSFYRFISDAPVCGTTQEELLGALKHETLTLKCEVDASPSADSFHWTFNSSGEPTDLPARLHSSEVWPVNFSTEITQQKQNLHSEANKILVEFRSSSDNILSRLITQFFLFLF